VAGCRRRPQRPARSAGARERPGGERGRRAAGAPIRLVRDAPGALLRRAPADRARLARAPRRHRGARLPRRGEQRRRAGARASGGGRRGVAAATAAEHQLPVPLLLGGRVLRAAGGPAAGAPRHRLPGQLRVRGQRPGPPHRPGHDRAPGRRRRRRGVPRVDVHDRRRVHLDGRQPQRRRHPPGLGAHPGLAQRLPGLPSGRDRRPVRPGGGRTHRRAGRVRGRPCGLHRRGRLRHRRRDGPAGRLPGRRVRRGPPARRARHRRRGPGGLRPAGWGSGSGDSSSRTSFPTSSPWPRRWATAIRWAP
jgi:hypothetical protein